MAYQVLEWYYDEDSIPHYEPYGHLLELETMEQVEEVIKRGEGWKHYMIIDMNHVRKVSTRRLQTNEIQIMELGDEHRIAAEERKQNPPPQTQIW